MATIRNWRSLFALLGLMLPLALGGCSVVSEAPLFGPGVAPPHPLATGLWAMSGPGCEVKPNPAGDLPSCAAPLTISDRRMDWDVSAFIARMAGASARGMAGLPIPKSSDYVLVDGDPQIIEMLNGGPALATVPGGATPPPLKPSYMALRVLEIDRPGRIVRGIVWPVFCPLGTQDLPAGLERKGGQCVANTPEVVRAESKTLPPFFSFFLTWVSATAPTPPPAAKAP